MKLNKEEIRKEMIEKGEVDIFLNEEKTKTYYLRNEDGMMGLEYDEWNGKEFEMIKDYGTFRTIEDVCDFLEKLN